MDNRPINNEDLYARFIEMLFRHCRGNKSEFVEAVIREAQLQIQNPEEPLPEVHSRDQAHA